MQKEREVLIVDDEKSMVVFIKNYLKRRNIESVITGKGKEALEILKDTRPDLIFLDINLEDISGFEVLKEIKQKYPQIKVIVITGLKDREIEEKSEELRADAFISKPIILEEFQKVLAPFLSI